MEPTAAAHVEPSEQLKYLWEEIKLLQDSTVRFWQMYVSWYVWFYGANVLAMSWFVTGEHDATHGATREQQTAFAIFMIFELSIRDRNVSNDSRI